MNKKLDVFGKLIMEHLRDTGFEFAEGLAKGHWKAAEVAKLQAQLSKFDKNTKTVAVRTAQATLDYAIHEFLFALHEACEAGEIQLKVKGANIVAVSDGLQGELFLEDGWQARFSKYGEIDEA